MQKINVINLSDVWGEPVRVVVDGQCNHAVTDTEVVENFSGYKATVTYCQDCGAEYNELNDSWMETY